jgi:hypothetical protein
LTLGLKICSVAYGIVKTVMGLLFFANPFISKVQDFPSGETLGKRIEGGRGKRERVSKAEKS